MHIAVAQMNSLPGDLGPTCERMLVFAQEASNRGVELLLFPLPLLTGPNPGGLTESEDFLSDLMQSLTDFARRAPVGLTCVIPIVLDLGSGIHREVLCAREGKLLALTLLQHLGMLQAGPAGWTPAAIDFDGNKLVFVFGSEELGMLLEDELPPVDAVVCFASDSFNADNEYSLMAPGLSTGAYTSEARDLDVWLVGVNGVGGYDSQVFTGGSFVLAPWGELAAAAPCFEEALLDVDVDLVQEGPLAQPVTPPPYLRTRFLWDALTLCLRDYVEKQDLKGVVVPLTGQLSSAVVAVLAVDALGPTKVHGMMLPVHDFMGSMELCRQLALNLRIGFEDPLSTEVGECSRKLSTAIEAWKDDEILKHRLHTDLSSVILAHRARELGGCALGISDKTGMCCEWTLSACSAAAFEPLGDLYRSDVAACARQRNTASPVFPEGIIDSYDVPDIGPLTTLTTSPERNLSELDAILFLHVERNYGYSALVADGFDKELVQAVLDRLGETALWRSRVGMVPYVSQMPLVDRAWPCALGWRDHERGHGEPGLDDLLRTTLENSFAVSGLADSPDGVNLETLLADLGQFAGDDRRDVWRAEVPSDLGELESLWANGDQA